MTAPIPPHPGDGRVEVELEIDAEALAYFQAMGPDWEDRINAVLREAAGLEKGPAEASPEVCVSR